VRLGFGTRSEDLKKSYLVTFLGEEELDHKKTAFFQSCRARRQCGTDACRSPGALARNG
jgi:hypothetical protein